MYFKQKAGLALALAAIFTTGGSGLALADNVTGMNSTGSGTASIGTGAVTGDTIDTSVMKPATDGSLTITGSSTALTTGAGKSLSLDGGGTVTELELSDVALTIAGNGGALIASNGAVVPTVITNKAVTVGKADDVNSGGTLKTLNMSSADSDLTLLGGSLIVSNLLMNTAATVSVDPAWAANGGYNPGRMAIGHLGTITAASTIANKLEVAQNSQLTLGLDNVDWLSGIVQEIGHSYYDDALEGMKWSADQGATGYTAAFGVFTPQTVTVASGGIMVDGSTATPTAATAGDIEFKDQSLFVVNAGGLNGAAALSDAAGTTTNSIDLKIGTTQATDKGTGVYLFNAANGGSYKLIDNIATITIGGQSAITPIMTDNTTVEATNLTNFNTANTGGKHWKIDTSSDLLSGALFFDNNGTSTAIGVKVTRNDVEVRDVYPHLSNGMAGMVGALYDVDATTDPEEARNVYFDTTTGENTYRKADAPAGAAGIAFVSRATDNYFMGNHEAAAAVLEGAAQIAVAAGVPAVTNNVITRISSLIVDHNNLLNETQPAYGNEPGKLGIWVNPFYATSDVDGMDAGRFESGYEMNYGGAAFGLDYNVNEAFRLGLAMNVGGGDTESNGDFNKTEADFDFFGVSLYGSYTNGAFGLTGDVGFTGVDSEIDQNVPGSMLMSNLESNVDSDAFTVGLTGQYRFAASDNFNITPHLGLRYTKISVDDANVDLVGGGRVFDVTTEDQNLFQIPLGVEFSSNIVTDGGWTVTPSADLGVLFTAGDTDVESRARIAGTSFTGRTSADVNDSAAFQGRLGVKAAADNGLSLGLDYGILAGANQTDHQFSGMLRFEF